MIGMVADERVFARDPKNLSPIWMPGKRGVRNALLSDEELEQLAEEAKNMGGFNIILTIINLYWRLFLFIEQKLSYMDNLS